MSEENAIAADDAVETPDAGANVEATEEVVEKEESTTSVEDTDEGEGKDDGNDTDSKPKPKGVQKRIDELTREKYDERRRAELAEQKLEELKKQKPESPATSEKPKLDDFDTIEEFNEALFDWKIEERERERQAEDSLKGRADQSAMHQATVEASVDYLLKTGADKYPDFQAVAGAVPPAVMSDDMLIALGEIGKGADVAYYLGKNPAEAATLVNLSPVQLGRAIARIESGLVDAPINTPTKAPEPIKPSGNRASAEKDPAKMSDKEFAEWRRKQINQR